jgi:Methyltransferase domain
MARKAIRLLRSFAASPVSVARSLPGEILQKHGSIKYSASDLEAAWDAHLHEMLGAPWPCKETHQLDKLMADIGALLVAKGLATGRGTYGWYSDADITLARAVWCSVRHTQPEVVIETGVAHGVTSRIILEALNQNDEGRLWSVDLPHPLDHGLHAQTGAAVTDDCRPRWTYLEGASKRRLPALVSDIGRVDIFVHDSLHTAKNTLFEMEQAASAMAQGGVMLVDDIKSHLGFAAFAERHPEYRTMVCETEDKVGMFGVAINGSRTLADSNI